MALRQIPITSDPDSVFTVDLDGVVFQIRLTLNERTGRFKMDLLTEVGEPIVEGVACVVNFPLLKKFKDLRMPEGDLFFWDSTEKNREPNEDNLGTEVALLYQEAT